MILAHKIALDPTQRQCDYFCNAAGTARFVWNWALAKWRELYVAGERPHGASLKLLFNQIKYTEFPWLHDIHRDAHAQPFANLQKAFVAFFRRCQNPGIKRKGYPRFKSRKRSKPCFYVANDKFRISGPRIFLTRKAGWVRMRERLRFSGRITGAVVSYEAGKWFVSVRVDIPDYCRTRTGAGIVGVDVGVAQSATFSTGEVAQGPKALRSNLKQMRRLSRRFGRKKRGSRRRELAKQRLLRLHVRIKNVRRDWLHKLTTRLCRENQAIWIEDLHVRGMLANRCLRRAVGDECFGEFRRQLEYKSLIYGNFLEIVDRWFPSSKACHKCGEVNAGLTLNDRTFVCVNPACGWTAPRDVNAALNLKPTTPGFGESHARGEEGSGQLGQPVGETGLVEPRTTPRIRKYVLAR